MPAEKFMVNESNLKTLFIDDKVKNLKYVIPEFQRPYTWGTEEVETLLNDIDGFIVDYLERQKRLYEPELDEYGFPINVDSDEDDEDANEYFMGSLIFCNQDKNSKFVIDGAQRLTTFSLLLSLLYRKLLLLNESILNWVGNDFELGRNVDLEVNEVSQLVWDFNEYEKRPIIHRPKLFSNITENDNSHILQAILSSQSMKLSDLIDELLAKFGKRFEVINDKNSDDRGFNFLTNIKLIDRWLDKFVSLEDFKALQPEIEGQDLKQKPEATRELKVLSAGVRARVKALTEQFYFITVSTSNLNQAFKIFETINSRGTKLNHVDLYKQKLFNDVEANKKAEFKERWDWLVKVCEVVQSSTNRKLDDYGNKVFSTLILEFIGRFIGTWDLKKVTDYDFFTSSLRTLFEKKFIKRVNFEFESLNAWNLFRDEYRNNIEAGENSSANEVTFIHRFEPQKLLERIIVYAEFMCFAIFLRQEMHDDIQGNEVLKAVWEKYKWICDADQPDIPKLIDILGVIDPDSIVVPTFFYINNYLDVAGVEQVEFRAKFAEFLRKFTPVFFAKSQLSSSESNSIIRSTINKILKPAYGIEKIIRRENFMNDLVDVDGVMKINFNKVFEFANIHYGDATTRSRKAKAAILLALYSYADPSQGILPPYEQVECVVPKAAASGDGERVITSKYLSLLGNFYLLENNKSKRKSSKSGAWKAAAVADSEVNQVVEVRELLDQLKQENKTFNADNVVLRSRDIFNKVFVYLQSLNPDEVYFNQDTLDINISKMFYVIDEKDVELLENSK